MADGGVVAKAWVQVIPEMSGIQKEIADELGGVDKQTAKAGSSAGSGFSKAFKGAVGAIGGMVAAAGISDLIEQSAQVQSYMSRLSAAADRNGVSARSMQSAYSGLVGVLGESDRAVETSGNLFALCGDNEAQLESLTTSLAGAFSQFGDGLPIETLAEAANETARTGTVVGSMADALNWVNASTDQWSAALEGNSAAQSAFNAAVAQGASKEDAFNAALAACSTEGERQQLVVGALNALYGDAGQAYMDANSALIEFNKSQDSLSTAMSGLGGALMPLKTDFNNFAASIVNGVVPALEMMASGDVSGGVDALVGTLTEAAGKLVDALPTVIDAASGVVSGLILSIGEMLSDPSNATMVVGGFVKVFSAIAQAIPQILAALATAIPQIVSGIVQVLTDPSCLMSMVQGFVQLFMALVQALPEIISAITPMIPQIVMMIGQALIQNAPALLQAGVELFMSLVTALSQLAPQLIDALASLLGQLVSSVAEWAAGMAEQAAKAGRDFLDGIKVKFDEAVAFVAGIPGKVMDALGDLGSTLLESGKSLIGGLVDGIKKGFDDAVGAVKSGLDYIRGFFPFSPAKRGPFSGHGYTTYSGKALMEDLAGGIESRASVAEAAMASAMGKVQGFASQSARITGGWQVDGSDGSTAEALRELMRRLPKIISDNAPSTMTVDGREFARAVKKVVPA